MAVNIKKRLWVSLTSDERQDGLDIRSGKVDNPAHARALKKINSWFWTKPEIHSENCDSSYRERKCHTAAMLRVSKHYIKPPSAVDHWLSDLRNGSYAASGLSSKNRLPHQHTARNVCVTACEPFRENNAARQSADRNTAMVPLDTCSLFSRTPIIARPKFTQ